MIRVFRKICFVFFLVIFLGVAVTNHLYYYLGKPSNLKVCLDLARSSTNYDTLLLGPSTVFASYMPEIIDERLKNYSAN